jgi:hypothetical protein
MYKNQRRKLKNRNHILILGTLLMIILAIGYNNLKSVAGQSIVDSQILITSRFILWDENEKMIDTKFNINIIYLNQINNNTAYYNITIDNDYYSGIVDKFISIPINASNKSNIGLIMIKVNNETVFTENNIQVLTGVSGKSVSRGLSEYLISLNPFEWRTKEFSIFYGLLVSFFLSIFFAYNLAKYYKKRKGVSEIK